MVEFAELAHKDGKIVKTNVVSMPQSRLTSECWGVQAWGLEHCTKCEYKDTRECGGGKALKKVKIIKELKDQQEREKLSRFAPFSVQDAEDLAIKDLYDKE